MRTLFHPAFLHPLSGDPGVWVDLPDEGEAVLLDLPPIEHVPARKLMRVGHAVVTHAHMDHFVGFDHLLRVALKREEPLTVTGPEGFLACVRGRVGAYAWNLIAGYPVRLIVQELSGDVLRREEYAGATRMRPVTLPDLPASAAARSERAFRIDLATLDHGLPVLGIALQEVEHLAVNRDRLDRMGLTAGPWLGRLKAALRQGDERAVIDAERAGGGTVSLASGELAAELIARGPGQRLCYLTDLAATDDNLRTAARLVAGADLLVCEAPFLDANRALAAQRKHLTARQAGELARDAGAKRLAVFHLSPRYQGREDELVREAEDAFGSAVLALPRLSPAGR